MDYIIVFAFGFGSGNRDIYDELLATKTPEDALKYKIEHEDKHRTSMSKIVQSAWNIAKQLKDVP